MPIYHHIVDFARTIESLEAGLLVRSIMTYPLRTVRPEDDAAAFFKEHEALGFDCAPVVDSGRIVGMVYLADLRPGGRAAGCSITRAAMRPLHEVPLVSGDEPIARFIEQMRETQEHFWLVLNGTTIDAIVTRSDLWRLPVQLLAFGRIVHLERLMHELICRHVGEDLSWLDAIGEGRRGKIEKTIERNRTRNEQLNPLESTNFSDKVEIIKKVLRRPADGSALGGINALRDQLMHAREGSDDAPGIEKFLERLARIDRLIASWTSELHPGAAAGARMAEHGSSG